MTCVPLRRLWGGLARLVYPGCAQQAPAARDMLVGRARDVVEAGKTFTFGVGTSVTPPEVLGQCSCGRSGSARVASNELESTPPALARSHQLASPLAAAAAASKQLLPSLPTLPRNGEQQQRRHRRHRRHRC